MKRILIKIFITIFLLILLLISIIVIKMLRDKNIDYKVDLQGTVIPEFTELEIPFKHKIDDSQSLPFMASAVIDINNDGVEEIFLGGGPDQQDVFYNFSNATFNDITDSTNWQKPELADATFAATVVDTDNNGYDDLIITRTNGIWLYLNNQGQFTPKKLDIRLKPDSTPLSVAISDINRDGHVDLFVAGYIKKELVEGQNIFREGYGGSSAMLLNNGDNTFTDITKSSGLDYKHNTFMGIFVDIDNDNLEDLVVAHDTGRVKTWKNTGNNTFKDMPNPDSERFGYPMGIAVTDYQDDGLVDFFFSNVGSTPPEFLVKGDLTDDQHFNPKWIMFENTGNFNFTDIAEQAKLADYEFSWGAIFEDFNLDGRDDLVVSENYIGLPPHKLLAFRSPGRFLLQNPSGQFVATGKLSGVTNKRYSISPITADFNQDGYPDLIHVNLAGQSKAFISNSAHAAFLKVKLANTIESIAATISVRLDNGDTLFRQNIAGEGLCSDQSRIQIFGLGNAKAISVKVNYIDGREQQKVGSFENQLISF